MTIRTKVSPHFAAAEFDCHNGQKWPPAARRALELWCAVWGEPIREAFGPVQVTSGFRPKAYNASVGGAPLSYHRYELRYGPGHDPRQGVGVAVDVVPARGTVKLWTAWAANHLRVIDQRASIVLGVGMRGRGAQAPYPGSGFIHLDTGPRRTWVG